METCGRSVRITSSITAMGNSMVLTCSVWLLDFEPSIERHDHHLKLKTWGQLTVDHRLKSILRGHLDRKLAARSTTSNICVALYPSLFVSAQVLPGVSFWGHRPSRSCQGSWIQGSFETEVSISNCWGIDAYLIAKWHPYRPLHTNFACDALHIYYRSVYMMFDLPVTIVYASYQEILPSKPSKPCNTASYEKNLGKFTMLNKNAMQTQWNIIEKVDWLVVEPTPLKNIR